ncbi:hypothetical protein F5B19DRAFT_491487 [Rostrohypoxylon terebratum]|nr:hypothetical protein F5B19DRAFT_491487 [Rostrohypoxylon terebratum]
MPPMSGQSPIAPQKGASSAYHYFSSRVIIDCGDEFNAMRGNTRFYTNLDPNAPLIDLDYTPRNQQQATPVEIMRESEDSGNDSKMESKMNIQKESLQKEFEEEDEPEINPQLPVSFLRAYSAARGPVDGHEGYPLAAWMHMGNAPARPADTNELRAIPIAERANIPEHPGWDDDPDDVEGDAPSVRIKPEDFLAFAQGAQRWSRDDAKDPGGVLIDQPRLRPASSEEKPPRGDKFPEYLNHAQSQVDPVTGIQITPTYAVPSSPSIVYTPPGIPSNSMRTQSFLMLYSRMHPLPRGLPNPPNDSSYERYTDSDVKRVLANVAVHGQTPTEAVGLQKGYIDQKLAEISQLNAQDKENRAIVEARKVQLEQLRYQYTTLKDTYIPLLQSREQAAEQARKEAEEQAKKEEEMREQEKAYHDGRVREHLITRVDDVHTQHHMAALRADESAAQRADVEAEIEYLEQGIIEECIIAGKSSFDDVYNALNNPTYVPEPRHAPAEDNDDSYGNIDEQMGGMSLDTPVSGTAPEAVSSTTSEAISGTVSVFEPGSQTSRKVEYIPGASDRAGGGTPVPLNESPSKTPKGTYVPREGRTFNLALAGSNQRSDSTECLVGGVGKGEDVPEADQEEAQEETQEDTQQDVPGYSTRYAVEEVGESSKQGGGDNESS